MKNVTLIRECLRSWVINKLNGHAAAGRHLPTHKRILRENLWDSYFFSHDTRNNFWSFTQESSKLNGTHKNLFITFCVRRGMCLVRKLMNKKTFGKEENVLIDRCVADLLYLQIQVMHPDRCRRKCGPKCWVSFEPSPFQFFRSYSSRTLKRLVGALQERFYQKTFQYNQIFIFQLLSGLVIDTWLAWRVLWNGLRFFHFLSTIYWFQWFLIYFFFIF